MPIRSCTEIAQKCCKLKPPFGVAFFLENMKTSAINILTLTSLLLVTACANYSLDNRLIGQERTALLAQMGQPEREYASQEFQKLHYPRGPAGWHTYFVYLDKDNKIARWEQVLTEDRFDGIKAGMTLDQVIDAIGITRIRTQLAGDRGYVWYYRYQNTQCRSFAIEFSGDHIVRGTLYIHRSGRRCSYVGP